MPASAPIVSTTVARRATAAIALSFVVAVAGWVSRAPAADVYATFGVFDDSYTYGFGRFNLATPTGTSGSYSYAWTTLMAPGSATLANLAMNPVSGSMSLQYDFNEYRTIDTSGVISGSLGPTPSFYGMAFDNAGELYAFSPYGGNPWLKLNAANGQTLTSGTLIGQLTASDIYSSFGGNMAARPAGGYAFADENGQVLGRFLLSGTDALTTISGSFAGAGFDPEAFERLCMFTSGTSLYLLSADSLFLVDDATAALTQLGTVTGLPEGFTGFTGAASMFVAVPEPGACGLAAIGLAAAYGLVRRRFSRGRIVRSGE